MALRFQCLKIERLFQLMGGEGMRGYGATAARLTPDQKVGSLASFFEGPYVCLQEMRNSNVKQLVLFSASQVCSAEVGVGARTWDRKLSFFEGVNVSSAIV